MAIKACNSARIEVMDFESRYKKLNQAQRGAVDHIDGPLMVVAGPGTGKTELLSMRAANILAKTDTLPSNILCLTFTESGAAAMRQRLSEIIGADAYKVAIHTFHSFGSEIINQNGEYFYNNAYFQPASELHTYEIVRAIFESLEHTNPLASMMNGEYTHIRDATTVISEIKKSGLTSDELLAILEDNERVLDASEKALSELFANRISKTTKDGLGTIAMNIANLDIALLPPGVSSLVSTLALSISHAVDAAEIQGSTRPITTWRNAWLEKNAKGTFVFKDRKRIAKLRALSYIYYKYLGAMQSSELYDFDDMVLQVVHALEVFDDLRYNLQERYLYIMVDEYQDTNLAQERLLRSLCNNPTTEGAPNIMIIGDDDQAIYSFQGAEISNILQFKNLYKTTRLISLTENYRSVAPILDLSHSVVAQAEMRLEHHIDGLSKQLVAQVAGAAKPSLHEFARSGDERAWLVESIKAEINTGTPPHEITVLARRHHELVSLLPYFARAGIDINYERRENVLDSDVVVQLLQLAQVVQAMAESRFDQANALLPELFAHPAWGIAPADLWKLSITAYEKRQGWLEIMAAQERFAKFHTWLVSLAAKSLVMPLEPMLDILLGHQITEEFVSPLYNYFFSSRVMKENPSQYVALLEALRTIRTNLRNFSTEHELKLVDFINFVELHQRIGARIVTVRPASKDAPKAVNLMTAHKAKGLEFSSVYIYGAVDNAWGENVRVRSRSISYPENLPLAPAGDTFDERIRLFFVAMTRAKNNLSISYSLLSDADKPTSPASFLHAAKLKIVKHATKTDESIDQAQNAWYQPVVELPDKTMKQILAPLLENYKLSATHLNTFLDVSRGGPRAFLVNNLLHFPQAITPSAAYGSAVHKTLQRAHAHLSSTHNRRPLEDILHDFEMNLAQARLGENDFEHYLRRGSDHLAHFFETMYDSFSDTQLAELNFSSQQSMLGAAHLNGSLDVVDINKRAGTLNIIDYKTGKPSLSWQGKDVHEKLKLHKYRQQLMFYKLLVQHSRDYGRFTLQSAALQFIEPDTHGTIVKLPIDFDDSELSQFAKLIQIVWQHITALSLPDTTSYSPNLAGVQAFERDLLDGTVPTP